MAATLLRLLVYANESDRSSRQRLGDDPLTGKNYDHHKEAEINSIADDAVKLKH